MTLLPIPKGVILFGRLCSTMGRIFSQNILGNVTCFWMPLNISLTALDKRQLWVPQLLIFLDISIWESQVGTVSISIKSAFLAEDELQMKQLLETTSVSLIHSNMHQNKWSDLTQAFVLETKDPSGFKFNKLVAWEVQCGCIFCMHSVFHHSGTFSVLHVTKQSDTITKCFTLLPDYAGCK